MCVNPACIAEGFSCSSVALPACLHTVLFARQPSGHQQQQHHHQQQHLLQQQQEAVPNAAQAQPFSLQHLWRGRLLKFGAVTFFSPEQLASWDFDFTAFSKQQLVSRACGAGALLLFNALF